MQRVDEGQGATEIEAGFATQLAETLQQFVFRYPGQSAFDQPAGNPLDVAVLHAGHCRYLPGKVHRPQRSEEHTSELQSLMRISYAVFCLKKKNSNNTTT